MISIESIRNKIRLLSESLAAAKEPNHLQDKVIYFYSKQSLAQLNALITALPSMEPNLLESQSSPENSLELEMLLNTTRMQLKEQLCANWHLINGTLLSYTALPDNGITDLFCDIALLIAQSENQSRGPTDTPIGIIELLMPTVAVDSLNSDVYPDLKPSWNEKTHSWQDVDIKKIIKTYILGEKGLYLVPLKVLNEIDPHTPSKLSNFYYNYQHHPEETVYLNDEELRRLKEHSPYTRAVFNTLAECHQYAKSNPNLYGLLKTLSEHMRHNSVKGKGEDNVAGEEVYPAIVNFLEIYQRFSPEKISRVPETIKKEIAQLKVYGGRYIEATESDSCTYKGGERISTEIEIPEQKEVLSQITLNENEGKYLLDEKINTFELAKEDMDHFLANPQEVDCADELGNDSRLLESLKIEFKITEIQHLNLITADEMSILSDKIPIEILFNNKDIFGTFIIEQTDERIAVFLEKFSVRIWKSLDKKENIDTVFIHILSILDTKKGVLFLENLFSTHMHIYGIGGFANLKEVARKEIYSLLIDKLLRATHTPERLGMLIDYAATTLYRENLKEMIIDKLRTLMSKHPANASGFNKIPIVRLFNDKDDFAAFIIAETDATAAVFLELFAVKIWANLARRGCIDTVFIQILNILDAQKGTLFFKNLFSTHMKTYGMSGFVNLREVAEKEIYPLFIATLLREIQKPWSLGKLIAYAGDTLDRADLRKSVTEKLKKILTTHGALYSCAKNLSGTAAQLQFAQKELSPICIKIFMANHSDTAYYIKTFWPNYILSLKYFSFSARHKIISSFANEIVDEIDSFEQLKEVLILFDSSGKEILLKKVHEKELLAEWTTELSDILYLEKEVKKYNNVYLTEELKPVFFDILLASLKSPILLEEDYRLVIELLKETVTTSEQLKNVLLRLGPEECEHFLIDFTDKFSTVVKDAEDVLELEQFDIFKTEKFSIYCVDALKKDLSKTADIIQENDAQIPLLLLNKIITNSNELGLFLSPLDEVAYQTVIQLEHFSWRNLLHSPQAVFELCKSLGEIHALTPIFTLEETCLDILIENRQETREIIQRENWDIAELYAWKTARKLGGFLLLLDDKHMQSLKEVLTEDITTYEEVFVLTKDILGYNEKISLLNHATLKAICADSVKKNIQSIASTVISNPEYLILFLWLSVEETTLLFKEFSSNLIDEMIQSSKILATALTANTQPEYESILMKAIEIPVRHEPVSALIQDSEENNSSTPPPRLSEKHEALPILIPAIDPIISVHSSNGELSYNENKILPAIKVNCSASFFHHCGDSPADEVMLASDRANGERQENESHKRKRDEETSHISAKMGRKV